MQPPIQEIVQGIRSLEPFPAVAARVLELSGREDVVPGELIALIQVDPGLTAKVLKLCNSAYYGFQREIASLQEAGNLLGVRALVNLVLTSTANRYFRDHGGSSPRTRRQLWRRSVTHAVAARLIAGTQHHVDRERAYTVGLLQHVGSLVIDRFLERCQADVSAAVHGGASLLEAEELTLGMHHAEIGARLLARWELPEVLTDSVRHHHSPHEASVDPELAATVHLAETMAAARVAGDDLTALTHEVSAAAFALTGLEAGDFDLIGLDLEQELKRASVLLEI